MAELVCLSSEQGWQTKESNLGVGRRPRPRMACLPLPLPPAPSRGPSEATRLMATKAIGGHLRKSSRKGWPLRERVDCAQAGAMTTVCSELWETQGVF